MSGPPEVRGWCPTARRPMASADGLLIRARIVGGRLDAEKALVIAQIAADCGNGRIDLTQRAQFQIRGLSEATLPQAQHKLAQAQMLGEASDVAVLAAPFSERAHALALALTQEARLDARLARLPPKFLFSVDDLAQPLLGGLAADIALESDDDDRVRIFLPADPSLCVASPTRDALRAALALAVVFAARHDPEARLARMRDLVEAIGADAVMREARLNATRWVRRADACAPGAFLGPRRRGRRGFVGVAAPQGRLEAPQLMALARLAKRLGTGEIALTPWRLLALMTDDAHAGPAIAAACAAMGLIVEPDDPLLSVIACPGLGECAQALGETRALARELAPLARSKAPAGGVGLHVSGCAKGCARADPAPFTAIAVEGGRFDLVADGRAGDAPCAFALAPAELALRLRA